VIGTVESRHPEGAEQQHLRHDATAFRAFHRAVPRDESEGMSISHFTAPQCPCLQCFSLVNCDRSGTSTGRVDAIAVP
jgi:hypothetical protein